MKPEPKKSVTFILSKLLRKMSKDIIETEAPFLIEAFNYTIDTNPWRAAEFLTKNVTISEYWCVVFYLDLIKNDVVHSEALGCTGRLFEIFYGKESSKSKEAVDRILSDYLKIRTPHPAQLKN